jgi:hypothetical protein
VVVGSCVCEGQVEAVIGGTVAVDGLWAFGWLAGCMCEVGECM